MIKKFRGSDKKFQINFLKNDKEYTVAKEKPPESSSIHLIRFIELIQQQRQRAFARTPGGRLESYRMSLLKFLQKTKKNTRPLELNFCYILFDSMTDILYLLGTPVSNEPSNQRHQKKNPV